MRWGIATFGGRGSKKTRMPRHVRATGGARTSAWQTYGYLVSSQESAERAHGRSLSLMPMGIPLYPIPTIRSVDGSTMHAPTCRFGSLERNAESIATDMK